MYRRTIRVLVPVATFVAGVIVQLLTDRLTNKSITTSTRLIGASLGGLALVVAILAIIISFDYADRLRQINSLGQNIDHMIRKFGLSVEFIADHPGADDGLTYERIQQLIAKAKTSLVFVDFYTETAAYRTNRGVSYRRRRTYYAEILRQIELRSLRHTDGAPFHRRIIQARASRIAASYSDSPDSQWPPVTA